MSGLFHLPRYGLTHRPRPPSISRILSASRKSAPRLRSRKKSTSGRKRSSRRWPVTSPRPTTRLSWHKGNEDQPRFIEDGDCEPSEGKRLRCVSRVLTQCG